MCGRDLVEYNYDAESNEWCEATFQVRLFVRSIIQSFSQSVFNGSVV